MKTSSSTRLLAICMVMNLFLLKSFAQNSGSVNLNDSMTVIPFSMTVVVVEFEARSGNQGNQLKWSTILEANLSHYEIERSTPNQPFRKIGTIKAAGSGSLAVEYSFTDKNPAAGTNIYRLRMVDTRGGSKSSEHKLVNGNTQNLVSTGFQAYPNPARNGSMIRINVPGTGIYQLRLVGLDGGVVYAANLDNSHGGGLSLDLPKGLRSGLFMIDAVAKEGGHRYQQKILIQ
jgi:hypothetical protein